MDAAWRGGVCEVKCEQGGGALSSASDAGNTTLPGGNTRLHWTVGPSPVSIGTLSIWLWGGLGDPVTGSVFVVTGGGAGEVSLRRVARPLAMADVGSSSSPAHETRLFRAAIEGAFLQVFYRIPPRGTSAAGRVGRFATATSRAADPGAWLQACASGACVATAQASCGPIAALTVGMGLDLCAGLCSPPASKNGTVNTELLWCEYVVSARVSTRYVHVQHHGSVCSLGRF